MDLFPPSSDHADAQGSSRARYRRFVRDYKRGRLDDQPEPGKEPRPPDDPAQAGRLDPGAGSATRARARRREYLREYLRRLWPHRYAAGTVFVLALVAAGLQMVEPLFMRFIIDRVLLDAGLDSASRLARLHLVGALFVGVIVLSNLIGVLRDYRQRLLNVKVMLSLRRSLYERLLHLPLQRLWDMKTGGTCPA
jgi:ATP-binding cassette subfamily B protein/subfamily B ATP-binding cassette protein MsbA